jgi:hypothetical protein
MTLAREYNYELSLVKMGYDVIYSDFNSEKEGFEEDIQDLLKFEGDSDKEQYYKKSIDKRLARIEHNIQLMRSVL